MDHRQLLRDLLMDFDEKGLEEISALLKIDLHELEGRDRGEKAYELIKLIARQGRGSDLVEAIVTSRPELASDYASADTLSWLDKVAFGTLPPTDELPTQAWSKSGYDGARGSTKEDGLAPHTANEEGPTLTWPKGNEKPSEEFPGQAGEAERVIQPPEVESARFFGREQIRALLATNLQNSASCAVIGSEGIGKTALLRFICHYEHFSPERKMLFAYLDLGEAALSDPHSVINAALASWYGPLLDAPPPTAPTISDFVRQIRTLHGAGFSPVLCLDHFESLASRPAVFDDELFEEWHVLADAGQLVFLTGSRDPMMDLLRRSNLASNFHRSLLEVRLGLLDESTAQSLIAWKAESEGIALSGPIQDYVVEVCGCHPKYIELAVEALAESKQAGDSEAKLSATVLEAITPLWQKAWQSLTSLQRAALASPITDDAPLVLARQHRSLEELALIQREGKGYRHFSKAFGAWVGQQGQGRSSTDPVQ